ncbi:hypothetical protein [Methylomagnum sp.]
MIWNNCKADTLYYDGSDAATDWPCKVELDGGRIRVSYEDDDGETVVYEGHENGIGHFELNAPQVNGRATLHRFENGKILEGYWVEEGYRGMWRIILG